MTNTMTNNVRAITKEDLPALKKVLDSIELFPSEMLDDMSADFFINPESPEYWFTKTVNNKPVAIGFCAAEKLTKGTYNLYAIGVQKGLQGKGIGGEMMNYIEQLLIDKGNRILIVETSSSEDFKLTREFYTKLNYSKEAVIRDFWEEGDDKVVFWKKL